MRKFVVLAALYCGIASAQTAAPATAAPAGAAPSPIVGAWTWTVGERKCAETLRFRADGERQSISGDEELHGAYKLSATPTSKNFYVLSETVTKSNNKSDCAGDQHGAGDAELIRFIQFSPAKDQLIVCMEESLQACFGPLKKVGW